ncbi:Putative diacylglycerol O-acyltransferase [Paraconexibacter sp. AEG42_29]|uniref:Diacylglycerol O-acyltransferase n=1 Tax=Paraconexibacter sp. AEG42_29 TaxID=2997339 RepID=A0AAU7B0X1_9ACTN
MTARKLGPLPVPAAAPQPQPSPDRASAAFQYDRTIVRWGQGTEMTAVEAALWHASDRATLRAASVVVEVLDITPDWRRLVHGHSWALGRVPRLRQRVVSDPLRIGPPAWADTRVDLEHHVRRVQLGSGGTLADALAVASAMHEETFDPTRPLWQATLVEGLPGGQSAYALKLHHAMADDQALVALFELLHSSVREPTAGSPQLPQGIHEPITPLRLSAQHALQAVAETPLAVSRAATGAARTGATLLRHPARSIVASLEVAQTVAESLVGGAGAGSPLLRARSSHRAFHAIDLPTERLRAAAGRGFADGMLAAAIDALGRYHAALGTPLDELPVAVPLQLRLDGSSDRFARARISAPTGRMSAAQRVAVLRERVAVAEQRTTVDLVKLAAPAISRTPTALVAQAMERSNRPLALQAFVVRGLNRDAYLAGGRVLRMFSFGPTTGCALSATLVTHQDQACIGFNYDTAAVTDPALMSRCLDETFAELLADTLLEPAA